ncbi:MAG: GreA/GreB family elongation factor [Paracoccus sp.]|nr:GreA/GreB family elongation factor [Paracoccus sp. (in: a-proteobacteria)]
MVANGKKLAFTLVLTGSDLEDGELGIHTPMAQALLDAREGEEVEYQRGVELVDVRIISVMNG